VVGISDSEEEDGEDIILIAFTTIGSSENHFPSAQRNEAMVIQATGPPGRAVTMTSTVDPRDLSKKNSDLVNRLLLFVNR
jgi:hypothetical protein